MGRTEEVVIEGKKSKTAPVTSGIPQGSVLGPLLFPVYVNDLPDMLDSNIQLFADDTKIYRTIRSQSDTLAMQNETKLMTWSSCLSILLSAKFCTKAVKIQKQLTQYIAKIIQLTYL